MKVVLFCGGAGMRLRGHADDIPKPMVTIGSRPILWHLMKYYAHHGHKDFILCLGHKAGVIKDYFLHYDESASNDFVWSSGGRNVKFLNRDLDDWTITFVETGLHSTIAERLLAVEPFVRDEEMFLANYSDGLTDLDLNLVIEQFERSNAVASLVMVQPTASLDLVTATPDGLVDGITAIGTSDVWVNGGFFVLRREIFCHVNRGDELVREPFARLITQGRLLGYKYTGFWGCMDTFKDKQRLEELNATGSAPWQVWKSAARTAPVVKIAAAG
jgi:glucose-1-phosphate cytidylyltransferase